MNIILFSEFVDPVRQVHHMEMFDKCVSGNNWCQSQELQPSNKVMLKQYPDNSLDTISPGSPVLSYKPRQTSIYLGNIIMKHLNFHQSLPIT